MKSDFLLAHLNHDWKWWSNTEMEINLPHWMTLSNCCSTLLGLAFTLTQLFPGAAWIYLFPYLLQVPEPQPSVLVHTNYLFSFFNTSLFNSHHLYPRWNHLLVNPVTHGCFPMTLGSPGAPALQVASGLSPSFQPDLAALQKIFPSAANPTTLTLRKLA